MVSPGRAGKSQPRGCPGPPRQPPNTRRVCCMESASVTRQQPVPVAPHLNPHMPGRYPADALGRTQGGEWTTRSHHNNAHEYHEHRPQRPHNASMETMLQSHALTLRAGGAKRARSGPAQTVTYSVPCSAPQNTSYNKWVTRNTLT